MNATLFLDSSAFIIPIIDGQLSMNDLSDAEDYCKNRSLIGVRLDCLKEERDYHINQLKKHGLWI